MTPTETPQYKADLARSLIHIHDGSGHTLCAISISPPRVPEKHIRDETVARAKADAELIVRALNHEEAHDDLVKALKELLDAAERDPENRRDPQSDIFWAMKNAQSALTKSKVSP